MRFLLDENLPESLTGIIVTKYEIDCTRVSGAISDEQVLIRAKQEQRILLTLDTDFLNILRYPLGSHSGVVVFRLRKQDYSQVVATVFDFLETFTGRYTSLIGKLVVVRKEQYRIYGQ